jgi:hypothetical protein
MKESVTYQSIVAEVVEIGKIKEARKLVRLLGENRFGPPDAPTTAALERIDDLAKLEALGLRILTARSWEELLELPAPRRSSGRRR